MSLFHTLNIGSNSLYSTRQGIDTTAHNIANAQTEGFSRQRVMLTQRVPTEVGNYVIGNGVYVGSIDRAHNHFLEQQLNLAVSSHMGSQTRHGSLLNLENIFSPELTSTVTHEMDSFFSALQDFSSYPEELSIRETVRQQGKILVESFRNVDFEMNHMRSNFNENIKSFAVEANDILRNISELNLSIKSLELSETTKANDLRDQRDQFLRRLAGIMNVGYYDDQHGMMTVRGPGDALLVEGGKSAGIMVTPNPEDKGMYQVDILDWEQKNPRNITKSISGGKIGGLLEVRDVVTPEILNNNNHLAAEFVTKFNETHQKGYGAGNFTMTQGRNFFKPIENMNFAAQNIALDDMILNSTDAISSASTANAPGDNVVANQLLSLKSQKLLEGGAATFTEFYANYIGKLGIETQRAEHMADADSVVYSNLNSRREAVSGVSLDEEATNMIKWQTAFTAASKVIATVDEMLQTVLDLRK